MKVTYHVFKDVKLEVAAATDEEALALQKKKRDLAGIKRNRYSFVSMVYHSGRGKLFLGATNRVGDILVEFDPRTGRFRSCGFPRSGLYEPNISKIHKGLTLDGKRDALYFGTASLSALPAMMDAPGGVLARYDIRKRKFTLLARPTPGDYHQATSFDFGRGRAYIYTRRGGFVVYDLKRKKTLRREMMNSVPHNGCIDDGGGVWGTHSARVHAFWRYDPDRDRFEFPAGCTYPNAAEAADVMFTGAGPADSMVNGGDGWLYTASALGEFYRLDPRSGELKFLGKPFPGKRLPGLAFGNDGWLYLCGGREKASVLARYSREEERFEQLGPVEAPDGTYLNYAHEIVVVDGVVYAAETDNPTRSGYLWACAV